MGKKTILKGSYSENNNQKKKKEEKEIFIYRSTYINDKYWFSSKKITHFYHSYSSLHQPSKRL